MPEKMPSEETLLIICQNPERANSYRALLTHERRLFSTIHLASDVKFAYQTLVNEPPKYCLIDVGEASTPALKLLEKIHIQFSGSAPCAIIAIVDAQDTISPSKLLHLGVQDHLAKDDISTHGLLRAIESAGRAFILQKKLNHLTLHDPLTNLPNRALFLDRLDHIFGLTKKTGTPFALLIIDLDQFKFINDTYGHDAGDELLVQVANTISHTLRCTDTAARLGGDEFAVLLPNISEQNANLVADKLTCALRTEVSWNSIKLSLSASIGLATYPSSATTHNELMREADMALYRAKQSGRDQYSIFDPDMKEQAVKSLELSTALEPAIINNELQIAYQPIYDLKTREISEVEALVRWQFKGEWIPPPLIVELVIQRRLSHLFHQWLFDTSLEQLKMWQTENPNLGLSINIPASLCHEPELSKQLLSVVNRKKISPETIIVELTETHLMQQPNATRDQLQFLADQGLRIAIDDFGTGYSSMEYLASLPCNLLKIDQQFFLKLEKNTKNKKIIEAIIALAHGLDLCVVGEGLETRELIGLAKELSCDYGQGFGLGFPKFAKMTLKEFTLDTLP